MYLTENGVAVCSGFWWLGRGIFCKCRVYRRWGIATAAVSTDCCYRATCSMLQVMALVTWLSACSLPVSVCVCLYSPYVKRQTN